MIITTNKNIFLVYRTPSHFALPFQTDYFEVVLSLVFCIFNTFFTIFCSSTKKARMILKENANQMRLHKG